MEGDIYVERLWEMDALLMKRFNDSTNRNKLPW